jgi:hypothetical protein
MASIESFLDRDLGLTVITVCGNLKAPEIPKCIDHYYKGNRNNMALFDFSNAYLSSSELSIPILALSPKKRISRKGDRKAFVFPQRLEKDFKPFLLDYCRIQETGSKLDVFANVTEANRWLVRGQEEHRKRETPPAANQ